MAASNYTTAVTHSPTVFAAMYQHRTGNTTVHGAVLPLACKIGARGSIRLHAFKKTMALVRILARIFGQNPLNYHFAVSLFHENTQKNTVRPFFV